LSWQLPAGHPYRNAARAERQAHRLAGEDPDE